MTAKAETPARPAGAPGKLTPPAERPPLLLHLDPRNGIQAVGPVTEVTEGAVRRALRTLVLIAVVGITGSAMFVVLGLLGMLGRWL